MFNEYLDCEIEIQPHNGTTYPFSIHAPGGDARGQLNLPAGEDYQALAGKLSSLQANEEELTQIGQLLFNMLVLEPFNQRVRLLHA